MKTYHIIDKSDYDSYWQLKHYTFEELKAYFEPDKEELPEEYAKWSQIENLEDLKEYLKWEYAGMAVPYTFEEDEVENLEAMKRANDYFKRGY